MRVLRNANSARIKLSNDFLSFSCACTFICLSFAAGKNGLSDVENPAFFSMLHCMGVRDPVRLNPHSTDGMSFTYFMPISSP